jgi:hypothetical protein
MSEQTEQRETNLRRWSECEPGECCDFGELGYSFVHLHITKRIGDPLMPLVLLSALIEAIRARKKHYVLESYVSDDGIWAKATMILEYGNRHARRRGYAAEPCDALLSAYVQALESLTLGKEVNHATP